MMGGVEVLPFKVAAYNKKNKRMEFLTEHSNKEEFENISGSRMRQMAKEDLPLPEGFMSPAGWEVLKSYYKSL